MTDERTQSGTTPDNAAAEVAFVEAVSWQVTARLDPNENLDMDEILELTDEIKDFIALSRDEWSEPLSAEHVAARFIEAFEWQLRNVEVQVARANGANEGRRRSTQIGHRESEDQETKEPAVTKDNRRTARSDMKGDSLNEALFAVEVLRTYDPDGRWERPLVTKMSDAAQMYYRANPVEGIDNDPEEVAAVKRHAAAMTFIQAVSRNEMALDDYVLVAAGEVPAAEPAHEL
jgi:hypothetical protein